MSFLPYQHQEFYAQAAKLIHMAQTLDPPLIQFTSPPTPQKQPQQQQQQQQQVISSLTLIPRQRRRRKFNKEEENEEVEDLVVIAQVADDMPCEDAGADADIGFTGDEPKSGGSNKIQVLHNIVVPMSARIELLSLMQSKCFPDKQKGKRFKDAHDFRAVYEDLFVPEQVIYAYNMSTPRCVICEEFIPKRKERCKFSVVNHNNPDSDCERCGTHVYCLFCFLVLQSAVIPGKKPVCFGTLLTHRGGCRQVINSNKQQQHLVEDEEDQ